MRILMLAHRIPYPPLTGDKARAYQIARHLARHHELTLGFLVDDPEDLPGVRALREQLGARVEFASVRRPLALARGLLSLGLGGSVTLPYFSCRALAVRVGQLLAEGSYDLIYVSSSAMAQYAPRDGQVPVVMDFVDVDSDKWVQYAAHSQPPLRWLYATEGRRLARWESDVARWASLCLLATSAEDTLLRSFAPWARTAVVENGVDLAQFAPLDPEAGPPGVIFTGAMDYLPNVDAVEHFCHHILPRVRRQMPDTRFDIVGLDPAPRVRRLAAIPGVTVTGFVADVRPWYARAAVAVAPLRIARGVQNKVIQAMALGIPVVATSAACRGIAAEPGRHLHVEDDAEGFAGRVVALLRNPEERQALGRQARAFVEAHHDWPSILARLDILLAEVARRSPVGRVITSAAASTLSAQTRPDGQGAVLPRNARVKVR